MGSISIDISLSALYRSWYQFKQGKNRTTELEEFEYNLEKHLFGLAKDLVSSNYKHGKYRKFEVTDHKKRVVSVSSVRDRVVHRLLYDYLAKVFDKTFIFDAWSCRKGKGLVGAIERTQLLMHKFKIGYVWRADIKKFFDNVDLAILLKLIKNKILDKLAIRLITEVVNSYGSKDGKGMPIGNLTSQIFANIYLNELDRYVMHSTKPLAYVRYGDDIVIFAYKLDKLKQMREYISMFLLSQLKLNVNSKVNMIVKVRHGIKFLGVQIFPNGRRLMRRNLIRIAQKLNSANVSSYYGFIKQHQKKNIKLFNWQVLEVIDDK